MAPNDEFIREVDDEYRRDRVAQIWKRYNGLIIGGLLVMLALVGRLALLGARAGNPRSGGRRSLRGSASPVPRREERRIQGRVRSAREGSGWGLRPSRALPPRRRARTEQRRGWRDRLRRSGGRFQARAALAGSRAPARRVASPRHRRGVEGAAAAGTAGGSHQSVAPFRPRASRPVGPEDRRDGFCRQLVRPDRSRPRNAASP